MIARMALQMCKIALRSRNGRRGEVLVRGYRLRGARAPSRVGPVAKRRTTARLGRAQQVPSPLAPTTKGARTRGVLAVVAGLSLACLSLAGALGCAGGSLDGQVYSGQGVRFRLGPVPPSWKAISLDRGALAYRDEGRKAVIAVNGRCGRDGEDVPLSALTQHLFIQFTERELRTEETVPFDGREARHTVLDAKLDGVKKTVDVWVLKKNGCVYDLIYIADPARYPEGAADFDRFARGFAALEKS